MAWRYDSRKDTRYMIARVEGGHKSHRFSFWTKSMEKKITIVSLVWMHVYLYSIHMMFEIEIPYSDAKYEFFMLNGIFFGEISFI